MLILIKAVLPVTKNCMLSVWLTMLTLLNLWQQADAQFREDFNGTTSGYSSNGVPGWNAVMGDGEGTYTQRIQDGVTVLQMDARQDPRNIWYAFIHRDVSANLNIRDLTKAGYKLRIEARVKPSHGPRRINMYLKSLATGSEFLREFDLLEAGKWYEISMTADSFRHEAGKPLLAQISFMDWGNTNTYTLEIDYIKVDVVKNGKMYPDKGLPIPYRPPLADAGKFVLERKVSADVTVDRQYPALNLSDLVSNKEPAVPVLMVDGTKIVLLRWDFSDLKDKKVQGPGQLELYTHSLYKLLKNPKDFGEIRICEIIGGSAAWKENEISYARLLQQMPESAVINEQTIVDVALAPGKGSKTTVTISQPVLQRLVEGKTTGIAILPLGFISAVLMDSGQESGRYAARLRLNIEK